MIKLAWYIEYTSPAMFEGRVVESAAKGEPHDPQKTQILAICGFLVCARRVYLMSTEEKNPKRAITEKNLFVFDQQSHQKLATDVIGVSFNANDFEVFRYGHGKSVGCVIPELRGLGWSST